MKGGKADEYVGQAPKIAELENILEANQSKYPYEYISKPTELPYQAKSLGFL